MTLSQLEFLVDAAYEDAPEIPCDRHINNQVPPCPIKAEWVLIRLRCCPAATDLLFCTFHKDELMALDPPMQCTHCRLPFSSVSEAILRIEPLNRKTT